MNLIIVASLSEPPSESLPFRHITLAAHHQLNLDCLIEVEQEVKDLYYKYLLHRGLMDFIEQLITPREGEDGIRLDTDLNHPLTIKLKAITFQNCLNVLGQIKSLNKVNADINRETSFKEYMLKFGSCGGNCTPKDRRF